MISVHYKNKHRDLNKLPKSYKYVNNNFPVVHTTPQQSPPYQQHQRTYQHPGSAQVSVAAIRASKLGISTVEWQRRDEVVRRLYMENTKWWAGDTFYPCTKAFYDEYGKCMFKGGVGSYAEIDHLEWPEKDNILIFTAEVLDETKPKHKTSFLCNLAFMRKEEPTE